jgi:hypothetical protein
MTPKLMKIIRMITTNIQLKPGFTNTLFLEFDLGVVVIVEFFECE